MSESKTPLVDELRAKLQNQVDVLEAELAPAREAHDRLVNDPRLVEARETIKRVSRELIPLKNELAALARAGGAKSIAIEAGEFSSQ